MKPRNAQERRIVQLAKTLAPIGKKHYDQAKEKCFTHEAWQSAKSKPCYCTFCGHEFVAEGDTAVCPHCGHKLAVKRTRRKTLTEYKYFVIVTTCHEYQIVRYLECRKSIHMNWLPENRIGYDICEVCRVWISPDGSRKWQSRNKGNVFWRLFWRYDTPITLKEHGDDFYCQGVYAPQRIIPELKRNGYRMSFHEEAPASCFIGLLKNQKYETLWKAGYHKLLADTRQISELDKYWPSLRICIRNRYEPEDVNLWYDMVHDLQELGKDTRNPFYVCPADLKAAHDEAVRQVKVKREREAEDRRREELRNDGIEFAKKKAFFGICFGNDKVKITVLKSLEEYEEEGKAMHHCVFVNRYYADKNSLCLSARDPKGKRLATIELSLKNFKVLQCRAACNKVPPLRKEIVKLVESHASDFRKAKKLQTA